MYINLLSFISAKNNNNGVVGGNPLINIMRLYTFELSSLTIKSSKSLQLASMNE